MPTDQAQDEFNALFADTSIARTHPEDARAAGHSSASHSPENSESESSSLQGRTALKVVRGGSRKKPESEDEDTQANGKMRSPGRYFLPTIRPEANTGPKGVIADAQAFEHAKRNRRFSFARRKKNTSSMPISIPMRLREKDEYGEKSSADSDEDDFMTRWRLSRLQEMQANAAGTRRMSPSKRHYGSLVTVDAEGYLDAIEKVHRDTVVVVYIYDDMSDVSVMMEACVRDLARHHSTVRFVKLDYEEAEMEPAGVPAILAYRGGEKFAGIVPVVDELRDDVLSDRTLGAVMQRHKILP